MPKTLPFGTTPTDSLVVIMSTGRDQPNSVYSVQMVSGEMRKAYCFHAGKSLDSVFAGTFARSFLPILDKITVENAEPVEVDYSFSTPGFSIAGLRVEDMSAEHGPGIVKLHFKRHIGDANQILVFEQSMEVTSATVRERVAVEVLRDIVSPIFDMLSLSASSSRDMYKNHSDAIQARLDRLSSQQDEIEFYTGLLKRYVAGCQQDAKGKDEFDVGLNRELEKRIG